MKFIKKLTLAVSGVALCCLATVNTYAKFVDDPEIHKIFMHQLRTMRDSVLPFEKHYALEEIQKLVEEAVRTNSIDAINSYHETALATACSLGIIEVVEVLVKAGASVESGSNLVYKTIGGYTSSHKKTKIVSFLFESGMKNTDVALGYGNITPLGMASSQGLTQIVDMLIKNGSDIDSKHANQKPIIKAASEGHYETVEFLIKSGAKVDKIGTNNTKRKYIAFSESVLKHPKIARLLHENGANVFEDKSVIFRSVLSCYDNEEIRKIINENIVKNMDKECPICFEELSGSLAVPNCDCKNKVYHEECFLHSISEVGKNCPMCRKEFPGMCSSYYKFVLGENVEPSPLVSLQNTGFAHQQFSHHFQKILQRNLQFPHLVSEPRVVSMREAIRSLFVTLRNDKYQQILRLRGKSENSVLTGVSKEECVEIDRIAVRWAFACIVEVARNCLVDSFVDKAGKMFTEIEEQLIYILEHKPKGYPIAYIYGNAILPLIDENKIRNS